AGDAGPLPSRESAADPPEPSAAGARSHCRHLVPLLGSRAAGRPRLPCRAVVGAVRTAPVLGSPPAWAAVANLMQLARKNEGECAKIGTQARARQSGHVPNSVISRRAST